MTLTHERYSRYQRDDLDYFIHARSPVLIGPLELGDYLWFSYCVFPQEQP